MTYDSKVAIGGCIYDDTLPTLLVAANEWRKCARSVLRGAQKDTDPIYRMMGARAVRYRKHVAYALHTRATRHYQVLRAR